DGMDGIASLQGMLGFATVAAIAALHGDEATVTICLLLVASVFGFAIFNAPPASIFLGDAGSMTIGYLLGAFTLSACHMSDGRYGLAIPLAVMIIPAFDTTMAIIRRAQKGKGIMAPDREHFHHCLFDAGRSVWKVLGIFAVMYGFCAAAAIAGVWTSSSLIASLACGVVLATCVGMQIFGHKELSFLAQRLASKIASLNTPSSNPGMFGVSPGKTADPSGMSGEGGDRVAISISAVMAHSNDDSTDQTADEEIGVRRAA
ncbi:MAG: undecaprenyl/decaprenyl-phosphate alpha-N-acetylglucosaminyl 1-phosphate transferase, partial [Rhodopirellula sp.]|nr:undecaprenyl/decaprenyl-phosphate alpha-N-acetylglucosaminyl 1-phosphate transferase [Rhodopirellula sp.]